MPPNSRGCASAPRPRYGKESRQHIQIFSPAAAIEAGFGPKKTSIQVHSIANRKKDGAAPVLVIGETLGWRQEDLSKASGVGTATIHHIEKSNQPVTGYASTIVRLQEALEDAGVLFID